MDDSLQADDLLIRYLDGELTSEDKRALEQRLQTDEQLQDKLEKLRVAVQAIRQFGTRQQVGSIHAQMMESVKVQTQPKVVPFGKALRYTMAVAATDLFLFIGIRFFTNAQL